MYRIILCAFVVIAPLYSMERVMAPTIREASASDTSALARMHATAFQATYAGMLPVSYCQEKNGQYWEAYWDRFFAIKDAESFVLLACIDDRIVGFIAAGSVAEPTSLTIGSTGEIFKLYISPQVQAKGIGSQLMDACKKRLYSQLHRTIMVRSLVVNARANAFYEKCGGIKSAEYPVCYDGKFIERVYKFFLK